MTNDDVADFAANIHSDFGKEHAKWIHLVDSARRGEVGALNELLTELRPFVRALAHKLLRNQNLTDVASSRFDASDITQSALLEVSQEITQFLGSTEPEFISWLKTILHHEIVDCVRMHISGKRRSVCNEVSIDASPSTDSAMKHDLASSQSTASANAMRHEVESHIREVVKTLDSPDREIVQLSFFENLSHAEIAEQLDLPVKKVSRCLARAKARLREILESKE